MKNLSQRILMFQNEAVQAMMLRRFVNQLGYLVHEVSDPEEAQTVLEQEEPFDVILLDLGVRLDRAFQILKACRERHPNTPVIVVSGLRQEEVSEWIRRFGVEDIILRPRSLRELLVRVESDLVKYAPIAS
ncbi:response regulator transcription factor [Deinococcus cellulosilyticus]|uniref:Response regulatory domain-containing protein n=1 Tax=Deinococcus cellulosilyticus (strain DSM 18568 / NBRC 106333 / KACC 11606 / 5516J-15) TaxID=1223518 RepID=A0A511N2S7_DEIC1|nr:response regulator [Deinococcus cellulosilyticus]GEM47155.1 hypothetical protein DC3_27900 [Deinococcus cellulosilyticus NBRC 106333 = KACC 11606]